VVPGIAERERAPRGEQRTDWMRLISPPSPGLPLWRLGRSSHASPICTALMLIARARVTRGRGLRLRNSVIGQLLEGY